MNLTEMTFNQLMLLAIQASGIVGFVGIAAAALLARFLKWSPMVVTLSAIYALPLLTGAIGAAWIALVGMRGVPSEISLLILLKQGTVLVFFMGFVAIAAAVCAGLYLLIRRLRAK